MCEVRDCYHPVNLNAPISIPVHVITVTGLDSITDIARPSKSPSEPKYTCQQNRVQVRIRGLSAI